MTKEKLIDMLKRLIKTDADMGFLVKLTIPELKTLVAMIRDRIDG